MHIRLKSECDNFFNFIPIDFKKVKNVVNFCSILNRMHRLLSATRVRRRGDASYVTQSRWPRRIRSDLISGSVYSKSIMGRYLSTPLDD